MTRRGYTRVLFLVTKGKKVVERLPVFIKTTGLRAAIRRAKKERMSIETYVNRCLRRAIKKQSA